MSTMDSATASLSDSEFSQLVDIIYENTRIKMGEHKRVLVSSRLTKRLKVNNLKSFSDYIAFIKSPKGEDEIVHFINAVTTNKTDFFRENKHFEYMKSTFLPLWEKEFAAGRVKNLRIWSAACSTGEEPYTIIMTLHEYFGKNIDKYDIKVLASDLDTNVINHAYEGVYREETVKDIESAILKRYFLKGSGANAGKYMVKDDLRRFLSLKQLNFKDKDFNIQTQFDIIFCRNVIIYFDKGFQKELFEKFYKYLKPCSRVFIGHSETLFGVSDKYKYVSSNVYERI